MSLVANITFIITLIHILVKGKVDDITVAVLIILFPWILKSLFKKG